MEPPRAPALARRPARPPRRLDAHAVAEVRRLRAEEGIGPLALARRFRVVPTTIAAILHDGYPG